MWRHRTNPSPSSPSVDPRRDVSSLRSSRRSVSAPVSRRVATEAEDGREAVETRSVPHSDMLTATSTRRGGSTTRNPTGIETKCKDHVKLGIFDGRAADMTCAKSIRPCPLVQRLTLTDATGQ